LDQRRADVLADLLLGRDRRSVTVEIQVTVPWTVLADLSDEAGELHGYGPIPATLARQLAAQGTWRRMLTDPVDGRLLEVSRRRFPGPELARHVKARDRKCLFPGCAKPAVYAEIDHTVDHAKGGLTAEWNLGPACHRHNRMKSEGRWVLVQTAPGYFTWHAPTGRTYHASPEHYEPYHSDHEPDDQVGESEADAAAPATVTSEREPAAEEPTRIVPDNPS
jgi:hypothetical protein